MAGYSYIASVSITLVLNVKGGEFGFSEESRISDSLSGQSQMIKDQADTPDDYELHTYRGDMKAQWCSKLLSDDSH